MIMHMSDMSHIVSSHSSVQGNFWLKYYCIIKSHMTYIYKPIEEFTKKIVDCCIFIFQYIVLSFQLCNVYQKQATKANLYIIMQIKL